LFENGTLKNKGSTTWHPYGNWSFTNVTEKNKQNEKWIRIKNTIDGGFLMDYGRLAIANETVEGKPGQLWKRGQPNNEGYYTLQNSESLKFITADTHILELKGKCIIHFTNWTLEVIILIRYPIQIERTERSNFLD
jgi:hypothetical protein